MFAIKLFKKITYLLCVIGCVIGMAAVAQANSLTASVDRDAIGLQETLTLTVKTDERTDDTPDFSSLNNEFEVLSTQRSSSIQIINGNAESSTIWQMTIAPKHSGTLLIPSFNVGTAVSDAIEIKVAQQSQTQSDSNEQVRVTIETSKKSVFVQEQVLVKIKLITEVNLSQAEMQPLELKNALVVNLDQQQYQTNINGKPHLIVETSYAIFPQENGDLTIPSLSYNIAVDNMRFGDPFGRSRNNILRLRTEEQHISVKPAPASTSGTNKNWQPANNVELTENWSASLDHLKIGEPVTRTITITADGLTGGQIAPTENNNIDGLTFYPDQAQTKDNKSAKGIQGLRVETIAIVPNRGGDFTLPEINVDWWDNNTQSMRKATLPAKTIHVLGDALTLTPPSTLSSQNNSPTQTTAQSTADSTTLPTATVQTVNPLNSWILAAGIFFALLSLALTIYIWQLKNYLKKQHHEYEELHNEISEKEKDIRDRLEHAAAKKDAPAMRKAILNWAKLQWPTQNINTLDEIAKRVKREDLTLALRQLDELLYSNHSTTEWDANGLLLLLSACKKERKFGSKASTLKPLYASKSD